jgi:inorganic pyrophosphatase
METEKYKILNASTGTDITKGDSDYWNCLEELIHEHAVVIERSKGQAHPRYPDFIYPLDYGYLKDTTTIDGGGIDIFVGSKKHKRIEGLILTVDTLKSDAEVKLMYGCSREEIKEVLKTLNNKYMRAISIIRPGK